MLRNFKVIFLYRRMNIHAFLFFCLLLISAAHVSAENDKCHRSTEGKEFWFGFMESRNYNSAHYVEITVTAREATTFTMTIGASQTPFQGTFSVGTNASQQIKIPWDLVEALGSESKQSKGIHLVSEKPVNVYALNYDRNSADVAVIYPTESLGKEYFAMCFEVNIHENNSGGYGNGRNSEFLVVATEDSTEVLIIPSKVTDQLVNAGDSIVILLNKGEVYQVQSKNRNNLTGQGDLTQSYIQSNKPIAFYSGSLATTIPATTGMSAWDHLYEQIPPIPSWGREYYTVPLKSRAQDLYRIIAAEDNTSVKITNKSNFTLNQGEFREIILYSNEPSRIIADKPIMVAQFSQSNRVDNVGDPFMIILSPVTQSKNDVTFVAYDSEIIQNYFVNIISLTTEVNNVLYDGNSIAGNFTPFPEGKYSFAQMSIKPGTHRINNINPDQGFLAYVYGYGGVESYGYGVGFNLDLVLDLGESINFEGDTLVVCKGNPLELDAGPYFDNYLWNTGETIQKISVTKGDLFWAQGTTIDGCVQRDSIYIVEGGLVKPNIGNDTSGCSPYSTLLDAGFGFKNYEWNTGASTPTISANTTGTYSVTVTDNYGCQTRDTMELTVFQVPVITMIGEELTCGNMFRKLELQFSNTNENMLTNGKMVWSTDQPDKLKITNKTNTSADITVSAWGFYTVSFTFTTPDNCEVPGSVMLQFWDIPTSEIVFSDNPDDKCKGYSREIIYKGNATQNASYFWDYGNSLADSIDWNKRRVSVAAGNAKSVISLHVEENGCRSDTSNLTMGANPAFVMNTAKSRGCDTATVQFSGELKIDDNLLFEWNFGDGSAINNLQTPIHFYADTGKYNVTLKITNLDNQCFVGYTENEMVKVFPTPTAKIELDPAFCNDSTVIAIYPTNIDSSFCKWDFYGTAHQIGAGNDTILVNIEKQIADIGLQVEEYGCTSKWAETTAKRKPFFDFSTDITEGCQPLQVLAKASTADENIEFNWLTDSLVTSGNEQNFILADAGKYDFAIASTSSLTGCTDTLTKWDLVLVYPKPFAQFEVDYPVAIIEHANLHFTNLTTDVDIVNWDFSDGATSIEENPQHTYTTLGKFPVQLIVESEFVCIDTGMMEIEIVPFNIYTPNAFRPDSEIPENREFMPVGAGADANGFQLQIYNRWGEVVFESNSPEHKWNGTTKNNQPAPMGNYIWKAEFKDIQGFDHLMKGQVILIR